MDILAIARLGSALSDVTRVAVFRLSDGKHAIADIARVVGISPSGVSYHLARLREAGLIEVLHRGRERRPRRVHGAWEWMVRAPAEPGRT